MNFGHGPQRIHSRVKQIGDFVTKPFVPAPVIPMRTLTAATAEQQE